jgi:hypothetical protein
MSASIAALETARGLDDELVPSGKVEASNDGSPASGLPAPPRAPRRTQTIEGSSCRAISRPNRRGRWGKRCLGRCAEGSSHSS